VNVPAGSLDSGSRWRRCWSSHESCQRYERVRHHQTLGDFAQITHVSFIHRQWTNLWRQGPDPHQITWVWFIHRQWTNLWTQPQSCHKQDPPVAPRRTCVLHPVQHVLGRTCELTNARLVPTKERTLSANKRASSPQPGNQRQRQRPSREAPNTDSAPCQRKGIAQQPGYRVGHAWC
jgi:hypothetical protein